jgi:hypothetical protein
MVSNSLIFHWPASCRPDLSKSKTLSSRAETATALRRAPFPSFNRQAGCGQGRTDRQEQPRTKCNGAQVAGLYKWQLGVPGETNVARFAGPGRSNLRPGFLVIGSVFGASRNFLVRRESGGDKKSQPKLGLSWSEEHRAD